MTKLTISAAVGVLSVSLAACGYNEEYNNAAYGNEAYNESGANYSAEGGNYAAGGGGNYAGTAAAGAAWPAGSRIVVENGVTYRIEPGGARVALGPGDSRIVVENGVRFRVDPNGTRVRIDSSGADISVGANDTTVNVTTNTE
jgi:hypothetical protein